MAKKLEPEELGTAMSRLPGWEVRDGKLARTYRFRDFGDAFAFMAACALRIHALDHHPEWSNVYSTVKVELVTHDAQGITLKDVELATVMESIAGRFPKP
jgi:4a-hydroxytetrahydrobiopterin dehydratase